MASRYPAHIIMALFVTAGRYTANMKASLGEPAELGLSGLRVSDRNVVFDAACNVRKKEKFVFGFILTFWNYKK